MQKWIIPLFVVPLAATALAQAPGPPGSDLGITKVFRPSPAAFVITVTNFGPLANTNIVVTDPAPAGVQFGAFAAPAPWTCTNTPVLINCTYGAVLVAGNSAMLTVPVILTSAATTNIVNCASVKGEVPDPQQANNRDCACIDVNPCRAVRIDLTTGQRNGAQLPIGAQDTAWLFGASGNTPSLVIAGNPTPAPPPPGRWIGPNPTSTSSGNFTYRFNFTLGNDWRQGQCRLQITTFRADNCVNFKVDNNPIFAQTPPGNCQTSAAWTVPGSGSFVFPTPAGAHTLTATVNNVSGPTGFYATGFITCDCGPLPNDGTNTSTAAN
jgi:hypothetical protein